MGSRARWAARRSLPALAVAVAALVSAAARVSGSELTGGAVAGEDPAASARPADLRLLDARVSPRRAYVAGRPVQISFRVAGAQPLALTVDVVREATRRPVRSFELPARGGGAARRSQGQL